MNIPNNKIDITPVTLSTALRLTFLSPIGDGHAATSGSQALMLLEASAVPLRSGVLSSGGVSWVDTLTLFVQDVSSDMPMI